MRTEQWLGGEWGEIHVPAGKRCEPLELFRDLERKSPNDYKQLLARFNWTATHGPQLSWFKVLANADGLVQIRSENYRYIFTPDPQNGRLLIVVHAFRKQRSGTEQGEIKKARRKRKDLLKELGH